MLLEHQVCTKPYIKPKEHLQTDEDIGFLKQGRLLKFCGYNRHTVQRALPKLFNVVLGHINEPEAYSLFSGNL